jgi:hypothetical protein
MFRVLRMSKPPREYVLDSPREVAIFLWDRDTTAYAVYHEERQLALPSADATEIEAYLAGVLCEE